VSSGVIATKSERIYSGVIVLSSSTLFLLFLDLLIWHSNRLLADGDPYWHLVVGEGIFQSHTFPTTDVYSHTLAGAPWIAKEWLSQVLFYLSYSVAGWPGVAFLTALVAALASSFLFAWLCRRVQPIVALTITAVTFSLGLVNLLARPLIFFYLLLTLCVCGLVDAVEKKKTPWWLPFLVALWANLHASFPIALVLAVLFSFEAVASAPRRQRRRVAARWGLALLAALAATGVTPYGYEPFLVSFKIVGAKELEALDEWKPMAFDLPGAYGAAFIIGSLAIVASARAGWARAALLFTCAALMVMHVRFFPLFAIVAAPSLATPIAHLFPRFARQPVAPSAFAEAAAAATLAAACIATIFVFLLAPKPVPASRASPVAALEAARKWPVSGNVFNDYPLGGFLIFNRVPTFVDGRTELFLNGFLKKTWDAESGDSDNAFLSLLDDYHVTWALFVNGSQGAEKLRRAEQWKEIFEDNYAIVFVRSQIRSF
jgi:hypothetical protein